jgi:hypothetical protein
MTGASGKRPTGLQAEVSRNATYTGGVIAEVEDLVPYDDLRGKRP